MLNDGSLPHWLPLSVLVFLAELVVVTISTVRVIFISRGRKILAPVLGFFEIVIWLFAIGQIMKNLSDVGCYVGFAAGFTLGNFLGVIIETKLALGNLVVRIITNKDSHELIDRLRAAQYGVTRIDGEGATGPVKIIFTIIQRRQLNEVVGLIRDFDPQTFYSVEEVQAAEAGIFPTPLTRSRWPTAVLPRLFRLSA